MSLLNNLQQFASSEIMTQIANCYGNLFPMEIRYNLAVFLESKLFYLFAPNESHPRFENDARVFLNEFIVELEKKASEIVDVNLLPTKMRLLEASRNMQNQNPSSVYAHLIKCMSFEQQLLEQARYSTGNEVHQVTQTTHREVEQLVSNIRIAEGLKKEWIRKNEAFRVEFHEFHQEERMEEDEEMVQQQDVDAIVRQLKQESLQLLQANANTDCSSLVQRLRENISTCHNLTVKVIDDYLKNWKWFQKYDGSNVAINGADLDCIQLWCEKLAESLWSSREQIRLMKSYQQQFSENDQELLIILSELYDSATSILQKLINGSFIIDQQPPQVMKTNTKFTTSVRLLVGNVLSIRISNPMVNAKIVSEAQAQRIFQTGSFTGIPCGRILNGVGSLSFSEATRYTIAKFTSLKLDNFKRPGKKAAENVTDEKFAMFFDSTFTIGDLKISITAMSLPIVVTVHGSQESQAWATIFWDNSFSDMNRNPFTVPDQVTWRQFSDALNQKFISYNERGLTPENLHFLAEKLFKMSFSGGIRDDFSVSWNVFCKENLQDRLFSFWEWFYAALRVTKDHLRGPWLEGSVVGFMGKKKVEEYLKTTTHGTFLLRFSDSELGSISIAWSRGENEPPTVLHIQPFNSRDLSARSLSDRLNDLEELKFLYPNMPKSQAFDRFRANEQVQANIGGRPSYVPAVMKLVVFANQEKSVSRTQPGANP